VPPSSSSYSSSSSRSNTAKKTLLGLRRPEDEGTLYNPGKCREIPDRASKHRGPESSAILL